MRIIDRSRVTTLVLFALLVVAGWHYAAPVDKVLDIGFADETLYLREGLKLSWHGLHTMRAPLYALWYRGLALFVHDPMALYDLNLRLQIILLPLSLFLALVWAGLSPAAAFVMAWAWLLSDANLEPWPRVSAFAWILLLAGIGWQRRFPEDWKGWAGLLILTGLSMYARPEMMLAFALLIAFAVWHRRRHKADLHKVVAGVLLFGLLAGILFGSPNEKNRLFEAFGQHFAFRWQKEYLPNGTPWNHWRTAIDKAFGPDVHTVAGLFRTNPQKVLAHIHANAVDAVSRWGKLLFSHTPYILKHHSFWEGILWALLFAGLAGWQAWRKRQQKDFWKGYSHLLLVEAALALPIVGSVLFIYPRLHYLLGLTLLVWFAWAVLVFAPPTRPAPAPLPSRRRFWEVIAVAALLTATTPPATEHFGYQPILGVRESLRTLRVLQRAGVKMIGVPQEWDGDVEVYLPGLKHIPVAPATFSPQVFPKMDAAVFSDGQQWLNDDACRKRLIAWAQEGWEPLCSTRNFYVILTRIFPPPGSVPMHLCFK